LLGFFAARLDLLPPLALLFPPLFLALAFFAAARFVVLPAACLAI
jgi:hypothetical protein